MVAALSGHLEPGAVHTSSYVEPTHTTNGKFWREKRKPALLFRSLDPTRKVFIIAKLSFILFLTMFILEGVERFGKPKKDDRFGFVFVGKGDVWFKKKLNGRHRYYGI